MELAVLKGLNAARSARVAACVVTDLAMGQSQLIREAEVLDNALGALTQTAFQTGKSGVVEVDGARYFLNVHVPPPRIVIIGAVHISQALASMAMTAGFDVRIIDPRTAFATPERFSHVALQADWPEDVLAADPLDAYTALVAVTHDPKIDDFPIQAALQAGCFYVGALGSRKTHGRRVERLLDNGLDAGTIARIAAPIGLPIGAATPAEIAVAILAEIIQSFRKRPMSGPTDGLS
jgi:xanthine dehydrogenase accessory factor